MKIAIALLASVVFGISIAQADFTVAPAVTNQQVTQPMQVEQTVPDQDLQVAEDKDALIKRLRDKNTALRQENDQLKQENAELQGRIAAMTSLGGSEVHAYCSDASTSRNTAGANNDCAATGYTCEPVSGLCRTIVRSSAECAAGWLMDVDHCVPQPTGE